MPSLGRPLVAGAALQAGPRPCSPPATRWRSRSTTCSAGGPGRGSWPGTPRSRPPATSPGCSVRSSAGMPPNGPARPTPTATRSARDSPHALTPPCRWGGRRRRRWRPVGPVGPVARAGRSPRSTIAGGAGRARPRLPAPRVEVTDRRRGSARRCVRRGHHRAGRAGRGEPRLVAARHDMGHRRPGRRAGLGRGPPGVDRRGRRRPRRLPGGRRAGHGRGRPQRGVRCLGPRPRRRRARPVRSRRARRRRRPRRW